LKSRTKKIVLVGGGFAGVNFLKQFIGDPAYQVTLVDTNNYHFFPPLLYQVASAFIEPSNISYPFRRMFQKKENLRFHLGTLQQVEPASNRIITDTGTVDYDYLVLAVGTETNFFGMQNVRNHALPMKTISDAINLRNHLLMSMENAARTNDADERQRYLNIVIAGGGPTGVEVAGMLAEMNHHVAWKEYPEFSEHQIKIYLVDAGPSLLGPMSKKSQAEAKKVLQKLGVIIMHNTTVKDYVEGNVILGTGESLPTATLVWASGVTGRHVNGLPDTTIGRSRRIMVDEINKVQGQNNIYAIGDICFQTTDPSFPEGHPQLAQVAIQQGTLLAKNFKRMSRNEKLKPFRYNDKGSMAIISKFKAVTDLPKFFVKGFFAWLLWLFIHIIPIAGFRNKVRLAFSWFWSFITNDPTLRLIIRPRTPQKE
jgi:NADH:ubiquinone reductase (H+-translocating)